MDRNECRERLAALIGAEHASTELLLEALRHEEGALSSGDVKQLEQTTTAKIEHLQALIEHEQARNELARANGQSGDQSGMARLIGWCDANGMLADAWHALLDLATQCRRYNQSNGTMVEAQRQHVKSSLRILRGQDNLPETYGRGGRTDTDPDTRPLAKA
jgi:flagella synthesis protein FlgN